MSASAIVPPNNRLPPDCGSGETSVSIAVVAEGFTHSEQDLFKAASRDLICNGAFVKDAVYKSFPDALRATYVPLESAAELTATPSSSTALQVGYTGARQDCYFRKNDFTYPLIILAAGQARSYGQILVLANIGDQDVGCTIGDVTFVTRGPMWQVVAHELGHVLGLYDEYADFPGHSSEDFKRSNCSAAAPAWWSKMSGAQHLSGCARHSDDLHAFPNCRMDAVEQEFCPVCQTLIGEALGPQVTPPPAPVPAAAPAQAPAPPGPAVQLAVRVFHKIPSDPVGTAEIIAVSNIDNAPPEREIAPRRGQYLSTVLVDNAVAAVADETRSFGAASQLVARAYGEGRLHDQIPADEAIFMIRVPRMTDTQLRQHKLEYRLVRVGASTSPDKVTVDFLNGSGVTILYRQTSLQLPDSPGRGPGR